MELRAGATAATSARTDLRADAVVVGAGLGGLLAGVRLARQGRSVVVLERADRPGGRFTAAPMRGAEVSTGALHLIPNGPDGALGRLLRELGVPVRIRPADVFCSVWEDGRHRVCRRGRDVLRLLPPTERRAAPRLAASLLLAHRGSSAEWLLRAVGPEARAYRLWRAFSEFALSLPLDRVTVSEMRRVTLRTIREGLPGVPLGGCRGVITGLVEMLQSHGGRVVLEMEATRISTCRDGSGRAFGRPRVTGVEARHRRTGALLRVTAPLVVSDVGPAATLHLCGLEEDAGSAPRLSTSDPDAGTATGLKIQLLSRTSLVPHRSVMLCLGTERVAGIVQPSNADPRLAPPGRHLVMSHQVLGLETVAQARAAGLRDLRRIFGSALDGAEILASAGFRGPWPVNRAAQGADVLGPPPIAGLHWVGDAHKPGGHIMVEGVAESVRRLRL